MKDDGKVENNVRNLDKTLHKVNLYLELEKQTTLKSKTVRIDTVQDLKGFNSRSSATQATKGEEIVSLMSVVKKGLDLMGVDIVDLSTENETLRNKIVSYDENWFEDSKAKLLKQFLDDKRSNLFES